MATRAPVVLIRLRLVGFLQVRFTNIEEREKAWRGERAEALAQLEKEKEVVEILEEKKSTRLQCCIEVVRAELFAEVQKKGESMAAKLDLVSWQAFKLNFRAFCFNCNQDKLVSLICIQDKLRQTLNLPLKVKQAVKEEMRGELATKVSTSYENYLSSL